MRMNSVVRTLIGTLGTTVLVAATTTASAVTIHVAGYTDSVVGAMGNAGFGAADAGNGEVYVSGLSTIQRLNTATGVASTFATPGGTTMGLELAGTTLYVSNTIGQVFAFDTTTTAQSTIGSVSGTVNALEFPSLAFGNPGEIIVAASSGVHRLNTTTGKPIQCRRLLQG
jgi:hypothetical protein